VAMVKFSGGMGKVDTPRSPMKVGGSKS